MDFQDDHWELVSQNAQLILNELPGFYSQLVFEGEVVPFEQAVQLPMDGNDWGINAENFSKLEDWLRSNKEGEVDFYDMGWEGLSTAILCCYAYATMAQHLAKAEAPNAWEKLADAIYWNGILTGAWWGAKNENLAEKKGRMRRLVAGRHRETRSCKAQAMEWYDAHRVEFDSDDDAAFAIAGKLVPMKFAAVRGWITEHKRTKK